MTPIGQHELGTPRNVVSGDFGFGFTNTTSLVIAISKGMPLRIVARPIRGGSEPVQGVCGAQFGLELDVDVS